MQMQVKRSALLRGLVALVVLPHRCLRLAHRVRPSIMPGTSMLPTLQPGQRVAIDTLAYRQRLPRRGEIVAFRAPFNPSKTLIKRVIGLPGDVVSIVSGGTVLVNGHPLSEPYVVSPARSEMAAFDVPAHVLFVLGDNRSHSFDSRHWGAEHPLFVNLLLGRVHHAH
jgi:signal peptidase I